MNQKPKDAKTQFEEEKKLTPYGKRLYKFYAELGPLFQKSEAKNLGFLTLSFLLVGFFIFFAIGPIVGEILTLQKELSNQKEVLAKQQVKINQLNVLGSEFQKNQNNLSLLNSAVPLKPEVENFIVSAEKVASQSSLVQNSIQFQNIRATQSLTNQPSSNYALGEVGFTQNFFGDYQNFKNYLGALPNFLRQNKIEEITIKSQENILQLQIRGKIFYLKNE